jgi:hypothetical protein
MIRSNISQLLSLLFFGHGCSGTLASWTICSHSIILSLFIIIAWQVQKGPGNKYVPDFFFAVSGIQHSSIRVLSFDMETNFPVLGTKFFCCYGTEQNAFCTLLWNTDQITLSFHHLFYYFYHVTFFVLQNVCACSRTLDSFAWFSQFIILSFFITFGWSLVCCVWGTTGCIFVC